MSLKQTFVLAIAIVVSYGTGFVRGAAERFELEGNMKLFGAGNGIIFPDGSKQTSAGVGSSNDVICTTCVNFGEISLNAVSSAEVAPNSLTADDLAPDSVGSSEIAPGAVSSSEIAGSAVGSSEIAASAVGTSEVADNSLTDDDLAASSVTASEIATDAVGASEIATGAVGSGEIATGAVGSAEVASKSLTLADLGATVFMNQHIDLFETVLLHGQCSGFIATNATGAPADSFALVFGVRPVGSLSNPGWLIEGEDNPTGNADSVRIRICNLTGLPQEVPNLRFNFWSIAP